MIIHEQPLMKITNYLVNEVIMSDTSTQTKNTPGLAQAGD